MGHHALAHGSTSLLVGKQWLGEMEMEERESGWFERSEECFESDPHPHIVFLIDFRVLSPWSRV